MKSQPFMYLTQYSLGSIYNENQILELADKMGRLITMPFTGCIRVQNAIASFTFNIVIDENNNDDNQTPYYTLTHIKKIISANIGSTIVLSCNIKRPNFTQGDLVTLVRQNTDKSWQCAVNGKGVEEKVYPSHYFVVSK